LQPEFGPKKAVRRAAPSIQRAVVKYGYR